MSSMDEVILAINFIEANLTKKMDLDMRFSRGVKKCQLLSLIQNWRQNRFSNEIFKLLNL